MWRVGSGELAEKYRFLMCACGVAINLIIYGVTGLVPIGAQLVSGVANYAG